jgi:hypothetical protein
MTPETKKKLLSELGALGGKARALSLSPERRKEISVKGSLARARALSPERVKEIAKIANKARWKNHEKKA